MSLEDLGIATGKALNEILNDSLEVLAWFDSSAKGANNRDCLNEISPLVLCSIARRDEALRVMTFKVPFHDQLPNGEWSYTGDRLFASVECHSSRTPLCWTLVAAVAAAIARNSASEVEDTASFFTLACDGMPPDAFIQSLAVKHPHPDAESAAVDVYERMNKSKEISAWLKKLSDQDT